MPVTSAGRIEQCDGSVQHHTQGDSIRARVLERRGVRARVEVPEPVEGHWGGDDKFPDSLGPFGVTKTLLLPNVHRESATYEVPLVGALNTLATLGVQNVGSISPLCAVKLSDTERRLASIPQEATDFCWAYALIGSEKLPEEQRAAVDLEFDRATLFISFGGFLYFNGAGACVQANVIGSGTDLVFSRPEPWRAEFTHALHSTKRIQRITIADLFDTVPPQI